MQDILTITLNPAIDISTDVDKVIPGHKLRCAEPRIEPGGGGINVSRAISLLGGNSRAFVALGGPTGRQLAEMLKAEPFGVETYVGPGRTRQSLAVMDRTADRQYRFVMPGPQWQTGDADNLERALIAAAAGADWVVLSGSMPSGLPDDFTANLCGGLNSAGTKIIVDISGPPLLALAEPGPDIPEILRMDQREAEDIVGRDLATVDRAAAAARELVRRGVAEKVVVAVGALGSVLADREATWHAMAADVPVVSKVGAGDSFVAAFTLALARGEPAPVALRNGSAAASAAVMTPDTQLCRRADAEELRKNCTLRNLAPE